MRVWWQKAAKEAQKGDPDLTPEAAAWPFNADSPVIGGMASAGQTLAVMLVDMTGLDWPDIEPLLSVARDVSSARGMVPVLVVDLTDFAFLRVTEFAYDVLPNAAANAPLQPSLDWPAYLVRRRMLLTEKWQPAAIVHLSQHAEGWE